MVGAGAIEPAFVGQQINTEALPRLISPNTSRISGLGARHAVRYVSKKAHQKDLWVMGCDFASPLTAPDTSTFRSSAAGNFRTVAFTSAGNVHPQGRRLLFNYGNVSDSGQAATKLTRQPETERLIWRVDVDVIPCDLAPRFYPDLSSFGRFDVPIWAVVAAGAGAELSA